MAEAAVGRLNFDAQGLIPVVVQDHRTGEVLTLAYMNRESFQKTLETGETHFWSRSRKQLWHKGETSGNRQIVKRIALDCDSDALLVEVEQIGNACHTGEHSCFYTQVVGDETGVAGFTAVVQHLARVIHERKQRMPEGSYTAKLLREGPDRILKKVGEEAAEVVIAAKNHSKPEMAWEVSDLLYHLLVLLEAEDIPLSSIANELHRRSGQGGGGKGN